MLMNKNTFLPVSYAVKKLSVQSFRNILDFIIPLQCASCEKPISSETGFICPECVDKLYRVPRNLLLSEYRRKFTEEQVIDGFWAAYIFEQGTCIKNIVHQCKYKNKYLVARSMGEMLGKVFLEEQPFSENNLIIPVPLHYRKKIQRGYNQSDYIVRGLSKITGIPASFSAIKRVKNTKTQTGLHLPDRKENMKNAFFVKNPKIIEHKSIILVDDVITTGATISECAKMLKAAGADSVYAVSLALAE